MLSRVISSRSAGALFASRPGLRAFSAAQPAKKGTIKITFQASDDSGDKETVYANEGDTLLDIAHDNDIEIEGACGGEMACSTCHVILEKRIYDMLPKPRDEEEDMLDLALGLTETSRLGCQVCVKKEMDGMVVKLPAEVSNLQSK